MRLPCPFALGMEHANSPFMGRDGEQCSILRDVDTASSKPADLDLSMPVETRSTPSESPPLSIPGLAPGLLQELWKTAEAESCGLALEEFSASLALAGDKFNYGLPAGVYPDSAQRLAFFRSLHLAELALAQACALGREPAWQKFVSLYRASLVHTAISVTGSATLGHELADSLYAELYGLRQAEGVRRSPLASYSGRGSLAGWLRATLVQRFRDHHRRTHREEPLDDLDSPAAAPATPIPAHLAQLSAAVARTLRSIGAEDRFLLAAYYLDRQTLLQIARTLAVHEATISRRLKRLAESLRKQLLQNLVASGLSKAAAQEALGADPRDIEINLRTLLQTSQTPAFSNQSASTAAGGST
jgi:RNA polymerase sigma-70 factor (ECF subfamily)